MSQGYIYCMSNPSMPGLIKIGEIHSEGRTPVDRAKELFTTGVPTPFKIEFAKRVVNPQGKEETLHNILEQNYERCYRREFFRISPEIVHAHFDLMDGEMWSDNTINQSEQIIDDEGNRSNRDLSKYFTHGQRICHTIGIDRTWIGCYDTSKNAIVFNNTVFKSLSRFAMAHYKHEGSSRVSANGWAECKCEVEGQWDTPKPIVQV